MLPLMSERKWKGAKAWRDKACSIAPAIVGGSKKHGGPDLGPTRALFRDAQLTDTARQMFVEAQTSRGIFYAEIKTENMINRTTGVAEHPRSQERVPAGTAFGFEISVR